MNTKLNQVDTIRERLVDKLLNRVDHNLDTCGRVCFTVRDVRYRYVFLTRKVVLEMRMQCQDGHVAWTPVKSMMYDEM